jgi:hypothetical protein
LVAVPGGRKRAGKIERRVGVSRYGMPVSAVFENLEAGATVDEITEWFSISKEQVIELLKFAARSVAAPIPPESGASFTLRFAFFLTTARRPHFLLT